MGRVSEFIEEIVRESTPDDRMQFMAWSIYSRVKRALPEREFDLDTEDVTQMSTFWDEHIAQHCPEDLDVENAKRLWLCGQCEDTYRDEEELTHRLLKALRHKAETRDASPPAWLVAFTDVDFGMPDGISRQGAADFIASHMHPWTTSDADRALLEEGVLNRLWPQRDEQAPAKRIKP